ncbi:MAG TPA: hypothetical protein VNC78_01375 [Actinomycetota bacterium]|nr:hypothetical protein [Actinomycetota bacterium]
MILAGPVFEEWYWGPLWFAVFFGPPILIAAGGITALAAFVARRRGSPLGRRRAAVLFLCLTPLLTGLTVGGIALWQELGFRRESRSAAQAFSFEIYWPTKLPDGYVQQRVEARSGEQEALLVTYSTPSRTSFAGQHPLLPARAVDPAPCVEVTGIGGTSGPCRTLETPEGNVIYIEDREAAAGKWLATRIIGESVVYLAYSDLSDDEVTQYFDSLAPRDPVTITFFNNYD